MIPALDEDGVLPPGIYECTLEEVVERFGRFGRTGVRQGLTAKLQEFVTEAHATHVVAWLGIDGSYITAKEDPNDIDMVLALSADHDFGGPIQPSIYNVVSRRRVKKRYDFDIMAAPENSPALQAHLEFFQRTRDGKPKGLLRVAL